MRPFKALLLLTLLTSLSEAEIRSWKSADGTRTLEAELLSRDETSVTLRQAGGRVLTFAIDKLHLSDQSFLKKESPHVATPENTPEPEGDAFGPLRFGDSRAEVEEKLLASPTVTTDVEETLFGRTGLNGIFETTETIGGLNCFLYFNWTQAGNLNEVTLRTKGLEGSDYNGTLKGTWNELITLLDKLYGKPLSKALYPEQKELQDGLLLGSHLWRTADGYSVLLGTAQEGSRYTVSVRFTAKQIQPVATP